MYPTVAILVQFEWSLWIYFKQQHLLVDASGSQKRYDKVKIDDKCSWFDVEMSTNYSVYSGTRVVLSLSLLGTRVYQKYSSTWWVLGVLTKAFVLTAASVGKYIQLPFSVDSFSKLLDENLISFSSYSSHHHVEHLIIFIIFIMLIILITWSFSSFHHFHNLIMLVTSSYWSPHYFHHLITFNISSFS